jgi:hypothetical protein
MNGHKISAEGANALTLVLIGHHKPAPAPVPSHAASPILNAITHLRRNEREPVPAHGR